MHPEPQALRRYLLGDLPPDEADSIERHMAACPSCEETFNSAGLEKTVDSFVEQLRVESEALPFDGEAPLQEMLEKVRGLGVPQGETIASIASRPGDRASLAAPAPISLGEYDLEEELGSGGMGTVYRAVHRRLRRRVAIKVLRADRTRDRAAIDRFEREMEAVGRLEHPHIVKALDAGEATGTLYLAMEYVDGASIAAVAGSGGPLPNADACEIVRQAAIGLAAAHRTGLIHRDVKPGNLMLARTASHSDDESPTVTVKVLDLGLARIQDATSPGAAELTSADQVMGTVDYMAPEQALSSRDVGPAADVYALGATLYRLLSGVSPLGVDPSAVLTQKLAALVASEPAPLATRRPDLPRPLCDLVRRTLSRDPAARPSAGELAKALQPFCAGADLAKLLEGSTDEAILEAALTDASATPRRDRYSAATPSPTKSAGIGGRNRTLVAVGLAGFLFAALVAGVMIFRIATDQGTLVVEIADPAIEAQLVEGGLKIVDSQSGRDYLIRIAESGKEASKDQASGDYRAVAPTGTTLRIVGADGLEVEANQFKLTRGETVRIKVYAEKNVGASIAGTASSPASMDLPASDDGPGWLALAKTRYDAKDFDGAIEAATKALSAGVEDRDGALLTRAFAYATRRILAESLADLDLLVSRDAQNAEALRLRSLVHRELGDMEKADADSTASAAIDPAQAERLRELPPASLSPNQEILAWIAAHGGGYGNGINEYATVTSVTFDPPAFELLSLERDVDDETVELLRRATKIDKLSLLYEPRISDAGFARLCSAPSLAGLSELQVNVPRVTPEGWKAVASLKRLRKLGVQFQRCPQIADSLVELQELDSLVFHDMSGWSAEEVAKLRDLSPTLREFTANGIEHADEIVRAMEGRPLIRLGLDHSPLDDEDVAKFVSMKDLEFLYVSGTNVTDASAETALRFPRLSHLSIGARGITDRALETLAKAPTLRQLHLWEAPNVTKEGVAAFRKANPLCEVLPAFDDSAPQSAERDPGIPMAEDAPAFDDGAGWLALAKKRYDAKDFDGAIEAATKALSAGVEDRDGALRTRAFAYATRRKLREAIDDLTAILSANPQDAEALRLRSLAHREMEDAAKADADDAAAATIDPTLATKLAELPAASLSPDQRVLKAILAVGGGADVFLADGSRMAYGPGKLSRIVADPAGFEFVEISSVDPRNADEDWILEALSQASEVRNLGLSMATFSDDELKRLAETPSLANLEGLVVKSASSTSEAGWQAVASLKRLRSLHIEGDAPAIPESLAKMEGLESLRIDVSKWSDAEVDRLRDLPRSIRVLSLLGTNVGGDRLLVIVGHRPLRTLLLEMTSVSDADVTAIAAMKTGETLEALGIGSPNIGDAVVETLRRFPKLAALSLLGSALTPEGLAKLGDLPGLVHLKLGLDQMPREAIDAFRERNPRCAVMGDSFAPIPSLEQERAAAAAAEAAAP